MLRNENISVPGYHARCASQTQHTCPVVSTQPPLVHRQWSVDVPKAITIPLSVQTTLRCLNVGGRHYVAWISMVLILPPSRSTIPHFCAMLVTRSGTTVVWGKWDAQSPTLPLDSYHFQSNACGIITVMDYTTIRSWAAMPFALYCSLVCGYAIAIWLPYSNF